MFIEPHLGKPAASHRPAGWIELVCGAMFSGKTEELIRRVNRSVIARQKVKIFKPELDKRYHPQHVVSHNENTIHAIPVDHADDIALIGNDSDVIGIDEVQFFDDRIVEVCIQLANAGKRVIAAGLDMDFSGKPFGPVPALMAVAEFVTKLHAICTVCGGTASFSYRMADVREKVMLGEKGAYEARCRNCFNEGMKASENP